MSRSYHYLATKRSSRGFKDGKWGGWTADEQARHNRKRRVGILTPELELSATVARQTGDDDLAEQIENA